MNYDFKNEYTTTKNSEIPMPMPTTNAKEKPVDPMENMSGLIDLCAQKALKCFDTLNEASLKLNGFAKMDPPEIKGPAILDHMRFLFELLDSNAFIAEEIGKRF